MLPFLKQKQVSGLIISHRKADGQGVQESHSEDNKDEGLETCGEELIRAITAKDAKAVAAAFRSAWQILESEEEPEDGEAPSPHTYDDQNEKAAE